MHQAVKRQQRSRKDQRLEARVTPDQKRLIERAAELRGSTVTDFVVVSAQQAAAATIRDFGTLVLRDQARDAFINSLLNPPPPNDAARAAAQRYKTKMGL
jgi:uncharacterized protein (DUF1778 family)